ncbi:ribonuclease domain-containing protein [Streptomyces werraensis]|uniref:ribonuclease domain-containing protein n=1 Tax=Streptomyces werraensis TaxID=68284 RepID=UPI003F4CB256
MSPRCPSCPPWPAAPFNSSTREARSLRDGSAFGGVEGLLPRRERGDYRAYTVPTPGSDDRGARRIVTGRNGETYYTDDPYASFTAVPR